MQVFVTKRAERDFDIIVDKLEKGWGTQTAKQFVIKTDKVFNLLENYPSMGSMENANIRGFQLSKQSRLLYRVRGEKIIILSFFDVRQHPSKKLG
jgi:plasmid stabilization system protein ParE